MDMKHRVLFKMLSILLVLVLLLSAFSGCKTREEQAVRNSEIQHLQAPESREAPQNAAPSKPAEEAEPAASVEPLSLAESTLGKAEPTDSNHVISLKSASSDEQPLSGKIVPVLEVPTGENLVVTVDPFMEAAFLETIDEMDSVKTIRRVAATASEVMYMVSTATSQANAKTELLNVTGVTNAGDAEETQIPERDLAAEYTGETQDEDGNLLVPFDVAFPQVMEENAEYCTDHILIKTLAGFDGMPTREMKLAGITELSRFMQTEEGDWFRASLAEGLEIDSVLKKARSLTAVLCAEYDFTYEAEADSVPESEETLTKNPQAGEQWYLDFCGIQEAWEFLAEHDVPAGGSSSVIVALIDTGVDYTHPDLAMSMWTNRGEIPDNGVDDDGNGYVDDIHGADTIANSGDPMDDHGHGTHVAGIIGAANNNIGIVGVAYNTKIMAVKAGQQSGVFNQSDIAEAIIYAWRNGADVINMSFGGVTLSIAVQEALATAYTRCVLIAAAGNHASKNIILPIYPAAFSYVTGVMSIDDTNTESLFTNYDVEAYDPIEYEVYAPGEKILSTFPDERYISLNGTSMAAPIVAGIAALLRSYYSDRDMYPSRFIAAQIAATSDITPGCRIFHGAHNIPMVVNAYEALTKMPKPEVHLHDFYINDNDDGYVDAGDTLELGLVLRNRWGMSKNTVVTLDTRSFVGYEANTDRPVNGPENHYVEVVKGTKDIGSVGTYSTNSMLLRDEESQTIIGIEDPLILRISKDCPNDSVITIRVHITYKNGLDETDETEYGTDTVWGADSQGEAFTFTVRNGLIKKGQITEDETWTKDNFYIIPESLYIAEGATVTVEQGTHIQFYSSWTEENYGEIWPAMLTVGGRFITQGTADEPVYISISDLWTDYAVQMQRQERGHITLNYTVVENPAIQFNEADHCLFEQVEEGRISYYYPGNNMYTQSGSMLDSSIVTNSCLKNLCSYQIYGYYEDCMFYNTSLPFSQFFDNQTILHRCVFMGSESCRYNIHSFSAWSDTNGFRAEKVYESESSVYWTVEWLRTYEFESFYYSERFAESLGGHLACFETEEEYLEVTPLVGYGGIGLLRERDTWINGAPVGDWIDKYIEYTSNGIYGFGYTHYGVIHYNYGLSSLIEIPRAVGEALTEEDIQEKLMDFVNGGYNSFTGNAVINNYQDKDLNNWFRLQCPTGKATVSVAGNWWGTTDEDLIHKQIVDFDYNASYIDLDPSPWLTEPPANVWPFVTDAYVLDHNGEKVNTVGNEAATFVVEFNRDMDTDFGLRVRFGAAEPYAEYEIEGAFVTPRRWEGNYTLRTTIENGTQYCRIEDGRAADDQWLTLCETPARYAFEIDTTSAMAMMMQGNPTETGIELMWMQDDYDTLAGYNAYRSNKEDGFYTRLNNTVIPVGEEHFFDDTVEPGKLYYYNFTVVLSDMSETTPSGKITVQAMDTMAPNLYHTPVRTAYLGSSLVVSTTATDNLTLRSVTLYYRTAGAEDWTAMAMDSFNDKYTAVIPAEKLALDGLEYYIEASDGRNVTRRGSADMPYAVTIKTAVDENSKGDVDGDGIITNRDALMIVQAVNDLLNLTEEQFQRADLNGDGELSGAEALRILKFVSGKVTTIVD